MAVARVVLSIVVKSHAALAVRCGVLGGHRFSTEYLLPSSEKGLSEMAHRARAPSARA